MPQTQSVDAQALAEALVNNIKSEVKANGGSTTALKPSHRLKFQWPPHPISYSFHVLASDWTGSAELEQLGEKFEVKVAKTPNGVFGKCEAIWLEARGDSIEDMLENMRSASAPFFERQARIATTLGLGSRFAGHIRDLAPLDLLKLLYCTDRDVANEAQTEIETHARSGVFTLSLIEILKDRSHPNRRSAQWCVLDMFEDLPAFCHNAETEVAAVKAVRGLVWDAEDDFARVAFKAGVVLGGHIPHKHGGPILLECLKSPSAIGRRSAIHGLYHVVEWIPEMKSDVIAALSRVAEDDPEPLLRQYASDIASDIEADETDHVQEPSLPGE